MIAVDAPGILKEWHSRGLASVPGMCTTLVLSETGSLNKAGVEYESQFHVATISTWGNGMIEFIVLDLTTKDTVVTEDCECSSEDEVRSVLNRCRDTLASLNRSATMQ